MASYAMANSGPSTNAATSNGTVRKLDKEQALGILNHLNTKELQDLLDNDAKLQELVDDNQQVKALIIEKQTITASNKSLSEYNLSREPRLTQGKERLSIAYSQAQELHAKVAEKKAKADNNTSNMSLEEALAMLKTSAESLENETDAMADSLMAGHLNIDTFLEAYIEKRSLAHNRKIKAEKMAEMVRNKTTSGPNVPPTSQPPQHAGWPTPTSVPGYVPPPAQYGAPQPPRYGQPMPNPYAAQYRSPYPGMGMAPQQYMPRR